MRNLDSRPEADPTAHAFDTGAALGQISSAMRAVHAAPATAPAAPGQAVGTPAPASASALTPTPTPTPTPASAPAPAPLTANQVLAALTLLREVRTEIAGWEPELIEAARALGTSWADLAPALGVASRQAAERRYLRLRPSPDGSAGTGEQKVAAERDKRAGDKAVTAWARTNAADLRQLAGQVGALNGLGPKADADLAALRGALGGDDAAALLGPLADARTHLQAEHPALAAQIGEVGRSTEAVRAASDQARRPGQP